jgi:hypothetical protein
MQRKFQDLLFQIRYVLQGIQYLVNVRSLEASGKTTGLGRGG